MFVRYLSIFLVTLSASAPMNAARAQEEESLSRSWPQGSFLCTDSMVDQYLQSSSWNKMEPLLQLSNCAHASVSSIRAFAYAISQSGGT
jgi:hypothetical protein